MKKPEPPTKIGWLHRENSLSSDLVLNALGRSSKGHMAYMVFRTLERAVGTQGAPTNRELSEMVGCSKATLCRALRVLESLGLVAREFDASGARGLQLFPYAPKWHRAVLEAVADGGLVIDYHAGVVLTKDTGHPLPLPENAVDTLLTGATPRLTRETPTPVSPVRPGLTHETPLRVEGSEPNAVESTTYTETSGAAAADPYLIPVLSIYEEALLKELSSCNSYSSKTSTGIKSTPGRKALPVTPEMQSVLEGWARLCQPDGVLGHVSTELASKVRSRLREGFTVEQLVLVADYAANGDAWLAGKAANSTRTYTGIETLYRSKAKTSLYLGRAEAWVRKGRPAPAATFDRRAKHLAASSAPIKAITF
jgi:hypothetical protein